jgi:hypothetical protein
VPKDYGSIYFLGVSETRYDFASYPLEDPLPRTAGVYFVTNRKLSREYHPTYRNIFIGQTADLSAEFLNHAKAECFTRHGANCVSLHPDEEETSRREKEQDLIQRYQPPCN